MTIGSDSNEDKLANKIETWVKSKAFHLPKGQSLGKFWLDQSKDPQVYRLA
jgi:hypothetical protein